MIAADYGRCELVLNLRTSRIVAKPAATAINGLDFEIHASALHLFLDTPSSWPGIAVSPEMVLGIYHDLELVVVQDLLRVPIPAAWAS